MVKQLFEGGNVDDAAREADESLLLHAVQHFGHVQATFAYFAGQHLHTYVEALGSHGAQAMVLEEAHCLLAGSLRSATPGNARESLALRGDEVQQVQPEYFVAFGKAQRLGLTQSNEAALGDGRKLVGVALGESEDAFYLQQSRGIELLDHGVAAVIGVAFGLQTSFQQKEQVGASLTFADNDLVLLLFREAKPRLGDNFFQVATVHALKERHGEQLLVEWFVHGGPLLSLISYLSLICL